MVSFISRSNEKIEPAYSTPPDHEYVSAGTKSKSPFEDLGLQGRRYVTDVVSPDVIESTLGEPAVAHPIRVYVGFNSEPLYATGRSEWALDEMDRLGAWDRSHLLLFSPTGTGWVDQTLIESVELMTRGDVATVCIQYGRGPSFLEVQNVGVGRAQFRQLLWGVKQRLSGMPEEKRPKVLVFGESLGAWSSSDVVMHQGIEGFDVYGIDRRCGSVSPVSPNGRRPACARARAISSRRARLRRSITSSQFEDARRRGARTSCGR